MKNVPSKVGLDVHKEKVLLALITPHRICLGTRVPWQYKGIQGVAVRHVPRLHPDNGSFSSRLTDLKALDPVPGQIQVGQRQAHLLIFFMRGFEAF